VVDVAELPDGVPLLLPEDDDALCAVESEELADVVDESLVRPDDDSDRELRADVEDDPPALETLELAVLDADRLPDDELSPLCMERSLDSVLVELASEDEMLVSVLAPAVEDRSDVVVLSVEETSDVLGDVDRLTDLSADEADKADLLVSARPLADATLDEPEADGPDPGVSPPHATRLTTAAAVPMIRLFTMRSPRVPRVLGVGVSW
jgi:hypothetical protein